MQRLWPGSSGDDKWRRSKPPDTWLTALGPNRPRRGARYPQCRAGAGAPGLEICGGQTAFELIPDRGLLRSLGGEAFWGERLDRRRARANRRPGGPFFLDLREQPCLGRGGRTLLLRVIIGQTAPERAVTGEMRRFRPFALPRANRGCDCEQSSATPNHPDREQRGSQQRRRYDLAEKTVHRGLQMSPAPIVRQLIHRRSSPISSASLPCAERSLINGPRNSAPVTRLRGKFDRQLTRAAHGTFRPSDLTGQCEARKAL